MTRLLAWTDEETDLIRSGATFEEYNDVFPSRRTQESYLSHRATLKDAARMVIDPEPDQGIVSLRKAEEWESYFTSLEAAAAAKRDLGAATKQVEWVSGDDRPIAIAFVGDIHAGADIDYLRFRTVIDTIATTSGLQAVCMGDLMENSKVTLKSAPAIYSAVFANPREQLEYVKRRMNICRGKWRAILQGNHDAFDYKTGGIDRLPDLCDWLGAPYMTEAGGTLTVKTGDERYVFALKHDWRGKSQINKTNSQRRFWDEWPEWENADVVCLAHLHEPIAHQEMRKGRIVTYLRTGTFKIHDEWAESNGYKPAFGVPVVILYPREHKVVAFHGSHFDDAVSFLTMARR